MLSVCSIALLILGGGLHLTAAAEPETQFLKGQTWQTMSHDTKMAYIWGMGNLAAFGLALMGVPSTPQQSFLPLLVKGLQGKSMAEVVSQLDTYYQTHPEQIEQPVIDGLFRAVVLPALTAQPYGGEVK
jgi:hypothetical protein